MSGKKRLRIFAGPNGSGKSTITEKIKEQFKLGVYVNADQMKAAVEISGQLDFSNYGLQLSLSDLISFIGHHPLYSECSVDNIEDVLKEDGNCLLFSDSRVAGGYMMLIISEYIRECLLMQSDRFTFETVLSDESKLDFMRRAKNAGFKVYLYFVALAAPEMNIERVKSRVNQGGHDVPSEKVAKRYYKTMNNLFEAMRIADNAYLFDNSYQEPVLIAQKERDVLLPYKTIMPKWYQEYVLDKIRNQ